MVQRERVTVLNNGTYVKCYIMWESAFRVYMELLLIVVSKCPAVVSKVAIPTSCVELICGIITEYRCQSLSTRWLSNLGHVRLCMIDTSNTFTADFNYNYLNALTLSSTPDE